MNWLLRKIIGFSGRKAACYKESIFTYSELAGLIEEYSRFISSNIPYQSITALVSDYTPKAIALFLALLFNKNIIVPIALAEPYEIKKRVKESFADLIIYLSDEKIEIKRINYSRPKHTLIKQLQSENVSGLVLFSSGSTGKPKAMLHNLDVLLDKYKKDYTKDLNTLIFLAFDHIGGIDTLFRQLSIGASITIPEYRSPQYICSLIEKYKVNVLPVSPTFLNLVLISEAYKQYDLSSLQIIAYGAEPMPGYLLKKLIRVFSNAKIQQKFGTSETGAFRVKGLSQESLFIKIDDPNIDYKIVRNELWLKSKTQILGYLNSSMNNFTNDGWFKTGDLVETADNKYLKIIGRSSEIINVGGEKVMPAEVESVLLEMPEIEDCMVYGIDNAITGQITAADIVTARNTDTNEIKKKVRKFCRSKLNDFKIPAKIFIVDKTNFNLRYKKIRK